VNTIAWQEKQAGRHGLLLERKEVATGRRGESKPWTICLAGAALAARGQRAALASGFLALVKDLGAAGWELKPRGGSSGVGIPQPARGGFAGNAPSRGATGEHRDGAGQPLATTKELVGSSSAFAGLCWPFLLLFFSSCREINKSHCRKINPTAGKSIPLQENKSHCSFLGLNYGFTCRRAWSFEADRVFLLCRSVGGPHGAAGGGASTAPKLECDSG